ncbi:hypothetical protein JOB18_047109 [Solea senegalensis]|uniref:Junctional protein associated with coronary artery disease n=1 Tax=Solea senegalensis TaxID=28829 RepID=A0AAV6TBR9_SOLSE|nr:junctional protein associated with coronary artery disease [Solea senegalensis]XP_043891943.1 junctional protein associated with coronary artery disease [Solea senegalensis]KAG7526947.1 junctional protein associated with coronary artery disease [Solea senegalensis]KAG7526948.1 hypothetical protein JOB18_047109 [Solea senegalensis]
MYSVEDLLISHGYKLPKHSTSSPTPTPAPASSSPPPSYNKHNEILENRPTSRTVNGYERGSGATYGNGGSSRQPPPPFSSGCTNNNNEPRDRSQPRREGESRSHVDTHSLGESLTSDSGFCDATRGPQSQTKDLSYWRRRGQDFTVLLDYADHGGHRGYVRSEGPQQARGQEMSADERQRAAQERQCWAAQVQAQAHAQVHTQAQAQARSREREAALHQWKMASERKCQSLGTDEWHPAVNFGRQLSQSDGEWWAQEQQRIHARTPEGMVVHPRAKAKSQSLPRMLQPESLQYVDRASSGQELYRRVNGHPLSHHDLYRATRWPENGRPASANQLSMTPKPRFTRPPRPPSYELHQQIRGSYEMLSATLPQARDRTPLPISRTSDPQLDYFAQDSGPPGYIPPPSYKRAPIMAAGRRGYGEIAVDYRYRGDVYQQIQVAPDGSHWFTRHPAASWPDPQRERSLSSQKQLYPVYTTKEHIGGGVQYISFDDPRIRHISSALGGNSLTDADKIRHIRNELPSVTVSEPASDDSAFLPPPLGPFIAAKLADDANQMSCSNLDNDNNRWHRDLHKETVDNFPATDQNYNNRYPKNHRPPSSPSSTFHSPLTRSCSRQGPNSDQVFAETITQVKKIAPDSGPENNRNTKRRVSETIFCLVSVPVHTPGNISKDLSADQNNNETIPSLTVTNTETFAVGLKEAQSIRSKSVNEMPIKPHYSHCHTSSISSMRNYKRAPLMKEIIDAWALQASEDKELCYAGSWPGNQYRNQETQTGSPLTVVKSPEPQSPPGGLEPIQSVSDTTADIGVGTDNTCGYSMTGQRNLHLSSNSAFSRLSLSPVQPPSMQPPQQPLQQDPPTSPSKAQEQANQQPPSPRKTNSCPPECAEQVAFGQFLLKPVNRRPCDLIGELESINKKMEDTISKRPHMGQATDNLDGMNNRIDPFKSEAHFIAGPEPGREALSLPPMHTEKPTSIKVRSKSFHSTSDLDSMDVRGTFSRPEANNMSPTNEQTVLPSAGLIDNCLLSSLSLQNDQLYRQDIPVPEESMLRDVGLTVYTETPGGPGEPVQRSLSVPSPLSHKETHQSVQRQTDIAPLKNGGSPERKSDKELQAETDSERQPKLDNVPPVRGELNLSRASSESRSSPKKEGSPHITRLIREASFLLEEEVDNETYAITEALTYKNELTIADEHLENLLFKEKANTLPTEDLSNLYEVKSAKGIPENESIEQRAARILGIAVPVEALGVADNQDETNTTGGRKELNPKEETKQVIGDWAHVREETMIVHQEETEEVQGTGLGVDYEEGDRQKHSSNHSNDDHSQGDECQAALVLDLPEFPPSKLLLSLPVTPDEKLALSMCSGEKKARGGACKLIESLQDKLNSSASSSATSFSRSTTDRMARLKELDSVSRIRRLSLKGSESGGEADSAEKDGDREETDVQEETKEEVEKQEGEAKKLEVEGTEEVYDENRNAHETQDESGDTKDVCKPKEVNKVICKEEQTQEEEVGEINVEIALKVDSDERTEIGVGGGEVDLRIVEEDNEKPVGKLRDGQNAEADSRDETLLGTEKVVVPKPKQRTRLQKPPLLPKPRSVPKREVTPSQHPSLGSGISGPSNIEDEETVFVSDTYDPSRVERV